MKNLKGKIWISGEWDNALNVKMLQNKDKFNNAEPVRTGIFFENSKT